MLVPTNTKYEEKTRKNKHRMGSDGQKPSSRVDELMAEIHQKSQWIATTGTNAGTNIEVMVQRPTTANYEQLKQDIEAQKEIEQHKYDAWEIKGEGFLNRDFGEAIFLKDAKMINDSDDVSNTKKLVIKEVSLSINGTDGGQGGLMRKMLGVKRI